MTTIYLVTNAHYSDGGTLAVFSTKEKAEEYVRDFYFQASIEEYELDVDYKSKLGLFYVACLINNHFTVEIQESYKITEETLFNPIWNEEHTEIMKTKIHIVRYLKNPEAIYQIASDILRQAIAEGAMQNV